MATLNRITTSGPLRSTTAATAATIAQLKAQLAASQAALATAQRHDIRQSLPAPVSAPPTGRRMSDNTKWEGYEWVKANRGAAAAEQYAKTYLPKVAKL